MSVLKNFPMVSQQTGITSDGKPSEDYQQECVAASIGAGILWYEGKATWDSSINPDLLKDQAYGDAYRGPTAAISYVAICAKLGYRLYPYDGIPGQLVTKIHQELAAQHPCLVTIPDPWVPSSYGWTHVIAPFSDEEAGTITMLDVWPGRPVTKTDREWTELLQDNQLWILEKLPNGGEEDLAIDIHSPGVADQFIEIDASHWRSKKTGKIVQDAILSEFKRIGYHAGWGHPLSNEVYYGPGKSKQNFDCAVPGWDSSKGKVELLPLYAPGSAGVDPALVDLEKQLAEAKNAPTLVQNVQAITAIQKIKALVEPF